MREFSSDASEGVSVEVLDLVEDNAFDGTSLQQHMAQTRRSIILRPVSSLHGPIEKSDQKQNIHCGQILEFTITNRDISLVHFSRSFRGCFSVVSTPTLASQASFFRIVQELHVCA